jgi:hypothetical protein
MGEKETPGPSDCAEGCIVLLVRGPALQLPGSLWNHEETSVKALMDTAIAFLAVPLVFHQASDGLH